MAALLPKPTGECEIIVRLYKCTNLVLIKHYNGANIATLDEIFLVLVTPGSLGRAFTRTRMF